MNIQFFHDRHASIPELAGCKTVMEGFLKGIELGTLTLTVNAKGGDCYALEVPSLMLFTNLATNCEITEVVLDLGIARCSDNDNYNKKIGRRISTGRMKPVLFQVQLIGADKGEIVKIKLVSDEATVILRKTANRVYFQEVV